MSLIILTLLIINSVLIIGNSLTYNQSARYSLQDVQAINIAEAGLDKAIASLNKTAGSYNGESETVFGEGVYDVTVATIDASNKKITATGYIPSKTTPKVKRVVSMQITKDAGASFSYGVQTGQGGLMMSNNARVIGSVYSNGNITMNNGSQITGDAIVAGGTQPTANQSTACVNPNCADYLFGKQVSGQNIYDVAQSFQPNTTAVINKVSLNLKKTGNPSDATVRILGNNNGSPNKNNVIASGTLTANLVTTQYGFVDVTFATNPTINANTIYWIVIDGSNNSSNYWSWSNDISQGYNLGSPKWSSNWQASNPVWTNIAGDFDFMIYLGGVATFITGANNAVIGGSAKANTLINLNVSGGAYYQTINSVTAGSYHPGSTDPSPANMPISEANIQAWKDTALANGIQSGNISNCPGTLSSKKYVGDVDLSNNCITTITDPVWITGDLELDNGSEIRLNPSYGVNSGVIIVDGKIKLSNNGKFKGSGSSGSFLLALSTYDSRTNGVVAIESDNGSNSSILYAGNGIIKLSNNAALVEVTGWKLEMDNGSTVTYNSGLASMLFTSGPSGNFSMVKGSYKIK